MLLVTSGDDECIGGENTQYIMDRMEAVGKSYFYIHNILFTIYLINTML